MEGIERKKIAFAYSGQGSVSWDVPFHPLYYPGVEKRNLGAQLSQMVCLQSHMLCCWALRPGSFHLKFLQTSWILNPTLSTNREGFPRAPWVGGSVQRMLGSQCPF